MMRARGHRTVICRADERGYRVRVVDGGHVVHEYRATNNPWDSQGPVLAIGVPLETLSRWAEETAGEMAEEWGADLAGLDELDDMEDLGEEIWICETRKTGDTGCSRPCSRS